MARPRFVPGSTLRFEVKRRSGIKDLAAYVASRMGVVPAWVEELVGDGRVDLDGCTAGPGQTINLSAGRHEITVRLPEAWPRHMAAVDMPLAVLYEDDALLVLDKPAGVVVHPARGHLDNNTLQNGVRYRYHHLLGQENVTIGPAHRLDKDTSGVVAFSRSTAAYKELVRQFTHGEPRKEYFAIMEGCPAFSSVTVEAAIGRDPVKRGLGKVHGAGEKQAVTVFEILEKGNGWTLARAIPITGRAHQIRIHAAWLGYPLASDTEYGGTPGFLGLRRHGLHAAALTLAHPISGNRLHVRAPMPADMVEALTRAGGSIPSPT